MANEKQSAEERTEIINGIPCKVSRKEFPDGYHDVYTFTVPGWDECSITGRKEARRVINGRCDAAVRNTMGKRWDDGK